MLIPFKELWQRHNIQTKGCLHLGSSIGQEAETYADLGIERVVWVEAIPAIYQKLVKHIARFPGQTALQACLGDTDGKLVKFNLTDEVNGFQSSSMLELGTHAQEHPAVKYTSHLDLFTTRVDTLLARHGIAPGLGWFLNIDLQGAELMALQGMVSLLPLFDYAYIEVNTAELYQGCPQITDIDSFMGLHGFARKETKMTRHGWGDALYVRA